LTLGAKFSVGKTTRLQQASLLPIMCSPWIPIGRAF
jgi:hypothetical protein